jgi:tetratricopeptide (TPR) repeat protein
MANTTLLLDEAISEDQFKAINIEENEENIILIWFDPNNELQNDTEHLKIKLHVVFHTELESCITFIQSTENKKIFLVISGSYVSQILSDIETLRRINCIFILSSKKDQYEHLLFKYTEIIGIYDKFDMLCSSIRDQIDFIDKQFYTWNFFDQDKYATRDLSKQPSDFLWFQLFHDVLLHFPRDKQAKKQMIDAYRYYYQDNREALPLIDEFEEKYQSNEAIRWYMNNSFLRKMINKALRTEDIGQLYMLRYFLAELIEKLAREHHKIPQSGTEKLTVYRQLKLSNNEFETMKNSKGKLISMKGFLTASHVRSFTKRQDLIDVLLEIECNDNVIFADITQWNESSCQEEILFDLNATFKLENIQQDEQLWCIRMVAVNDGRTITQKYIDDTHRQTEDLSIPIIFGKLIFDMNQWNQSQIYFQHLLNNPYDEDLARIEECLGQTYEWKREWTEARTWYDRAYDRMMKTEPTRLKDSADVLFNIGEILNQEGKYEEACELHHRVLTIRKNYYSSNDVHIAASLEKISFHYFMKLINDEALLLAQQALTIREEYYNSAHIDIGTNLNHIGCILFNQEKYNEALDHYRRAMLIYEEYYPLGHVYTAVILQNMSTVLYQQE